MYIYTHLFHADMRPVLPNRTLELVGFVEYYHWLVTARADMLCNLRVGIDKLQEYIIVNDAHNRR